MIDRDEMEAYIQSSASNITDKLYILQLRYIE